MAYASKRCLNCKIRYRMHQNALFRMKNVKKNFWGGGTAPVPPPPLGRGIPPPQTSPPQRLWRLDSRAVGTRLPLKCTVPPRVT